jgi:glycerate 2-kinase
LRRKVSRVCLISGGEVTVTVRNGGIGGRNQQFALACAEQISGQDITVLSAGTDGIDGNSPAAGAVVDGSTLSRRVLRSSASDEFGARKPCGKRSPPSMPILFSTRSGDTVITGPTGNNLRDLRICWLTKSASNLFRGHYFVEAFLHSWVHACE